MLSLRNVSAAMAANYFTKDDYYSGRKDATNEIDIIETFGSLRLRFNIGHTINRSQFGQLINGFFPDGTRPIVKHKGKTLDGKETDLVIEKYLKGLESTSLEDRKRKDFSKFVRGIMDKNRKNTGYTSPDPKVRLSLEAEILKLGKSKKISERERSKIIKAGKELVESLSPETRRAGLDMTFSAPKSVSLLGLVGGDKAIISCHQEAVRFALAYVERHYAGTRKCYKRQVRFLKTGEIIGASFLHKTSRAGDPQLHTHCVMFNMTIGPDGKIGAMSNDKIFNNSKLLGVIYKNKLAELIQNKGYEIEPKRDGSFEIKGYSYEQIQAFSKRNNHILDVSMRYLYEKEEKVKGSKIGKFEDEKSRLAKLVTAKIRRFTCYIGRQAKTKLNESELLSLWKKEAVGLGVEHPVKNFRSIWGYPIDVKSTILHLGEKLAVFSKQKAELHILCNNLGKSSFEEMQDQLIRCREYVALDPGNGLGSHIEQLKTENRLGLFVAEQRRDFKPIAEVKEVQKISKDRSFTRGQSEALMLTATSQDQFMLWNGVAGSGKSYALKDLKKLAEDAGHKVYALASDGGSARELGKSIGASSTTVHRYLLRKTKQNQSSILIIDEASKMSTRLVNELLEKATKEESRVIFVGDKRQFTAVEAGNPFSFLWKNLAKVELSEHQRQINPDLKWAVEQASLRTRDGLANSLAALGNQVLEFKEESNRIATFVKEYLDLVPEERAKTLLMVDLNHDRRVVTEVLRTALREEGVLGKEEVSLPILVAKPLSYIEKTQRESFQVGDVIVTHSTLTKLEAGIQYRVAAIDGQDLVLKGPHSKEIFQPVARFTGQVYRVEELKVATGDTLEWRKNQGTKVNRDEVKVTEIGRDKIIVQGRSGEVFEVDLREPQYLDHALVKTSYSAQGATANRAIALTTARASMESWYVTLSRARHTITVITDNKAKLGKGIQRSSQQDNALDLRTGTSLVGQDFDRSNSSKAPGSELSR